MQKMKSQLQKLNKKLEKIEREIDKCRTSALSDGWQTQRHAKKARKWDFWAEEKRNVLSLIYEMNDPEFPETSK